MVAKVNAWLETESGVSIPLHAICTIGRSNKNHLVLKDNQVSRRHALIHAQGAGEHWLVDLGSSNGILLNGKRVKLPAQLKDGDRLEIVSNRFIFHQGPIIPEEPNDEQTTFIRQKNVETSDHWLVVADIEKSTELSHRLPADEFSQLVGGWFLTCKEILENADATVNKYLGDGFLGYWPHSDIPSKSVAEALISLKELRDNRGLAFRLALHYGTVAIDKSAANGEESLFGPEVNFAFRMEKVAAQLKAFCLVSERAAQPLTPHCPLRELGRHPVPNFDGEHRFFSY